MSTHNMTSLEDTQNLYHTEEVACRLCETADSQPFIQAVDDYTGKPGLFQFVKCHQCGLVYQSPRMPIENITDFYDNDYIAHRKVKNWGLLTRIVHWAMSKHDRDKTKLVKQYKSIEKTTRVLDIGCAAGTFLFLLQEQTKCQISGVDFKDLSGEEKTWDFHHGLFSEQNFGNTKFDLITAWHYLEHDYDPMKTLIKAKSLLKPNGRLIIEVPKLDSLTFKLFRKTWPGIQAPQHTVLFSKKTLQTAIEKAGFEIETHLSWGAFPPHFYLFLGAVFKLLKGRGLNLQKLAPFYFLSQLLTWPICLFQKKLNLCMQTVVCKLPKED